jgi:hypothetical protein
LTTCERGNQLKADNGRMHKCIIVIIVKSKKKKKDENEDEKKVEEKISKKSSEHVCFVPCLSFDSQKKTVFWLR